MMTNTSKCKKCGGSGNYRQTTGSYIHFAICSTCKGSGEVSGILKDDLVGVGEEKDTRAGAVTNQMNGRSIPRVLPPNPPQSPIPREAMQDKPQAPDTEIYTQQSCIKDHYRSGKHIEPDAPKGKKTKGDAMFGGNREAAIQRDGEKCVHCGMTRQEHRDYYECDITVDHIDRMGSTVPPELRNNDLSNLQTLCYRCHNMKDNPNVHCHGCSCNHVYGVHTEIGYESYAQGCHHPYCACPGYCAPYSTTPGAQNPPAPTSDSLDELCPCGFGKLHSDGCVFACDYTHKICLEKIAESVADDLGVQALIKSSNQDAVRQELEYALKCAEDNKEAGHKWSSGDWRKFVEAEIEQLTKEGTE
jgi:hypothetical protein